MIARLRNFLFNITFFSLFGAVCHAKDCSVFRVHLSLTTPERAERAGDFFNLRPSITHAQLRQLSKRPDKAWVACVLDYMGMDSDHDGIRDWTVFDGEQVSDVLFPNDPDLDNDGIENIWDPDPVKAAAKAAAREAGLPPHLISKTARQTQSRLFQDFDILAVDHTDFHSREVLSELHGLYSDNASKRVFPPPKNLKFIYAFSGHDDRHNQGAFHRTMNAISVGGQLTYSEQSDKKRLRTVLLHEIGHAVYFDQITPDDVEEISKLGEFKLKAAPTFWESMLAPFAAFDKALQVSKYATRNFHEWFAESFASYAEAGLGREGVLKPLSLKMSRWFENRFARKLKERKSR